MLLFLIMKVVEVNVFLLDLFFLLRDKWLKIFVKFLFLILIIIVENIKNIKVFYLFKFEFFYCFFFFRMKLFNLIGIEKIFDWCLNYMWIFMIIKCSSGIGYLRIFIKFKLYGYYN